jgi:hypothetical protein
MTGKSYVKPENLRINKSVTIPKWKWDKLQEYAKKKDKNVSIVIEMGIDKVLGLKS